MREDEKKKKEKKGRLQYALCVGHIADLLDSMENNIDRKKTRRRRRIIILGEPTANSQFREEEKEEENEEEEEREERRKRIGSMISKLIRLLIIRPPRNYLFFCFTT